METEKDEDCMIVCDVPMSGMACDDSGTFSAMMSWKTVIDSSTVITANKKSQSDLGRTASPPLTAENNNATKSSLVTI